MNDQKKTHDASDWDFSGLRAIFLNCTLKRSPQADAAWVGEAGPGPSYRDPESGGPSNDFTNRNTTFMTWNLLHLARLLRDVGGIPAYGNMDVAWKDGERFGFENPARG